MSPSAVIPAARRTIVGLVAGVAVLVLGAALASTATADCGATCGGVATQPDGYVGSLVLPPGSGVRPAGLSQAAAHCDGCEWTLEPACQRPDSGGAMCSGA